MFLHETMKIQSSNAEVADRFRMVAQEFCSLVEAASKKDRTTLLVEIYRVLPRLIHEAMSLPSIKTADEDDEAEGQSSSPQG